MDSPMPLNQSKGYKMTKEVTIPNWSEFDVTVVGIELHRYDDDDNVTYRAAFTLFLDNDDTTDSDDPEDQKVITILTNNVSDNQYQLAVDVANIASMIWHDVVSDIPVIDEDGEVFQTLDLNRISEEIPQPKLH